MALFFRFGYNMNMNEFNEPLRLERAGEVLKEWVIPEYTQHERSRRWFIAAAIVCLGLITLSLWTPNPVFDKPNILFISLILLTAATLVARHVIQPHRLSVVIYEDGIAIGDVMYPFRELSNFAIVYQPPDVRMVYFHFQAAWRPRLPLPLEDQNPIEVRDILLKYLEENLERDSEPTSDAFGRWLKI